MHVVKIQSEKDNKTIYKVGFEDKEQFEKFKVALDTYKEFIVDEIHPIPGDIALNLYGVNPDTDEENPFMLYEVQDLLKLMNAINFGILSKYIYAAHEDPSVLQGEKWEFIKLFIEAQHKLQTINKKI